jgi:hypothetical protein
VLPQNASGANFPVSGEYGSSSEGTLQLAGTGQYLTLMGYGINAATYDAAYQPGFTSDLFGAAPTGSLAQSGSLTGQSYTAIPRVVALIDANGNVNSSTALYNIFNTNNPRSVYSATGATAYVSGQGSGSDLTGGVFYTPVGAINNAPQAITGGDANSGTLAQDTRTVQIYDGQLYASVDTKEGSGSNRSYIGTLGSSGSNPTTTVGAPVELTGFGNAGGTGKVTIGTGTSSIGNNLNAGLAINLSPVGYFFASPSVLYVADSGHPKNDSNGDNDSNASGNIGDGGLQKWVNSHTDGSGTWSLKYTLYQGLNLVNNGSASGTCGLYGLAGQVVGGNVLLYATNYTINDLDPTYLYGITDTLSNTTPPGTTLAFTLLDTAPANSNFKGVSFAPSIPNGDVELTSSPSGLALSTVGTGCAPGTYTTPITLAWTPSSSCQLGVVSPQAGPTGTQYVFTQWQDANASTTDTVTAPSITATYTAAFATQYLLTTSAGSGGTVSAGGYFNSGSSENVTATPSTGYGFVNFTGSATSTTNPLTVTLSGPQTVTANFAPLSTSLGGGTIGAKSGPQSARVWPVNIGNNGPGAAVGAELTNLTLTQTRGAACTPVITSSFPIAAGTIAPGASAVAGVTINFTGCAANAFFTVSETMSANGGAASGSATQLNQLQ